MHPPIYTFGYTDGLSPSAGADMAFEQFLRKILTVKQMRKRKQVRLMENAVKTVVTEILESY